MIPSLLSRAAEADTEVQDLDTSKIREWRSIVTLIVFVLTSKPEAYQQELVSDQPQQTLTCSFPFIYPYSFRA